MLHPATKEHGFTLVELLIVVIILAILAAIVIPQFSSSTEDAKLSSLQTTLSSMRGAVELYYQQHGQRYPGTYKETDGTTATATAGEAQTAFVAQLVQYTDANGKVSTTKDATYKYGPYLKSTTLPKNPFVAVAANATALLADITTTSIIAASTADGTTGWKFYVKIGRFTANDNTTLSDGVTTTVSQ
jgi:general secretion pathway protein G